MYLEPMAEFLYRGIASRYQGQAQLVFDQSHDVEQGLDACRISVLEQRLVEWRKCLVDAASCLAITVHRRSDEL